MLNKTARHPIYMTCLCVLVLCTSYSCGSPGETAVTAIPDTPRITSTSTIQPTSTLSVPTPTHTASATEMPELSGPTLKIPSGTAPVIDGVMEEGEWDSALHKQAGDGSDVLFLVADNTLYIGIRGSTSEMIVGNIFIAEGERTKILHASAALGTAIYDKTDDGWQQSQMFEWRCRSTSNSETAVNERLAFLDDEGWVSTNSRIGTPNELEYQIVISENPFTLAVNILRSSATNVKVVFPAELDDDVIAPTPGGLPEMMHFEPFRWAVVER